VTRTHGAAHVAAVIGKTENWVKRNAPRLPHHRAGKTYFWTDEDIVAILAALQYRPEIPQSGYKPLPHSRRRAS
jgi:hypothetical protein